MTRIALCSLQCQK